MTQQIQNLRDLVDYAADTYGLRDAYRFREQGQTYGKSFLDLQRDTRAFGRGLDGLGVGGRHVAVIGPTSYEWIVAYLGTVNSGGVIVPLDAQLPPEEICSLAGRSDAAVFVFDSMFAPLIPAIRAACPKVRYFVQLRGTAEGQPDVLLMRDLLNANQGTISVPLDNEALCAILFTSGTTGKSKGVMLSHRNLVDNACCMDVPYTPDKDVLLTVLPIHHAYCFTCDILQTMLEGIPVCINDSPMHLVRNLGLFQPTLLLLVPMIIESIYRQIQGAAKAKGLPAKEVARAMFGGRLRVIYSGGAYLPPELIDGYRELGIQLLQGYGMTECSPRISANGEDANKDSSVGKPVRGCEVRIVDHEVWAKSPSMMLGYYQDEENTRETLEDGWLKTGDLGYLDEDGYLFLTGRKKNLIILSNGENVSPEELENKLTSPLVREVMVYEEGSVIAAEIFPDYEYAEENRIMDLPEQLQGIIDELNRGLPAYKQIHALKIRDTEFEKTPSKKIKRKY